MAQSDYLYCVAYTDDSRLRQYRAAVLGLSMLALRCS